MFYNAADVTSSNLAAASAYPWVLGFNEPDLASQANMTVAQALALWPQLEAMGNKLISPATAGSMSAGSGWFFDFMNGVGASGGYTPRVDAIAVHSYTQNFNDSTASGLLSYIDAIYARWQKPIIVTEFSMWSFTGTYSTYTFPTSAQAQAFMTSAVAGLRLRQVGGKVLGWSWYPFAGSASAISVNPGYSNVILANPDGTLTTLGQLYASL